MRLLLATAITAAIVTSFAYADDTVPLKPGVWQYKSIPCADTTVVDVRPRLETMGQTKFSAQDFQQSGVQVTFATALGIDPLFPQSHAGVTHYQDTPGNNVMIAERPGDRVQVCFLGWPKPTQSCDPDKDSRGRTYRVYDYRQHASYDGMNSEHDCGGA